MRKVELTKFSRSAVSFCDNDQHVVMVPNVVLSHEDDIYPASMTSTKREGEDKLECTLGEQREQCGVFTASLKPEMRTVHEENASLSAAVNESKVGVR